MPDGPTRYPVDAMKLLAPRRKSTRAADLDSLVAEQLQHFGIDAASPFGQALGRITRQLYTTHADLSQLWAVTLQSIDSLDRSDKIAYFNAKKFLSFQLAKLLDTLQNPSRRTYQSLGYAPATTTSKGPYSPFDNVAAIFSATPVITRTATYIYACAEWIEEAFEGKELLLEIYSRLRRPGEGLESDFSRPRNEATAAAEGGWAQVPPPGGIAAGSRPPAGAKPALK